MIFSKVVLTTEKIRSFALLHSSKTLDKLVRTLEKYEESRRGLHFGNELFQLGIAPQKPRGGQYVRSGADPVLCSDTVQMRLGKIGKKKTSR